MDSLKRYWEDRYEAYDSKTGSSVCTDPEILNEEAKSRFADIILDELEKLDCNLSESKMLCVGSGSGLVSARLTEHLGSLYGVDFSEKATVQAARIDTKSNYCVGAAQMLPFAQNFDIVTASSILYHIVDDELWELTINELGRVVEPGGYVLCRINWEDHAVGEQSSQSHFYDRPRSEYQDAFDQAGLSVVEIVDLPVRPMGFTFLSRFPRSFALKRLLTPLILAGSLWGDHQNKLVILQS